MGKNAFQDGGGSSFPTSSSGMSSGNNQLNGTAAALARKLAVAAQSGGGLNPQGNNSGSMYNQATAWLNPNSNVGSPTSSPYDHVYMSPTSDPKAFDQVLRDKGLGASLPDKTSPYQDLMSQLMSQLAGINGQYATDDELRANAQSQVNSQYDPIIALLNTQIGQTTDRGHQNEDKARQMYNDLGSSFDASVAGIQQQNQAAQGDATKRYDDAATQMQQQYANQAAQQQAVMDKLGIQAAAGDPRVQQAATDQQYFTNQNAADKQHQVDMLQQIGAADTGYQHGIASSSRMAGENTAQDIGRQLEDYLGQANTKLTGLQTQKNSDLTNLFNQLKSADQQRVSSSNQNAFQQLMALNNFQLNTMNADNQNQLDQQKLALELQKLGGGTLMGQNSGMSGAANLLAQRYGQDTNTATTLENILQGVLSQPDIIKGKQDLGNGQLGSMTPEYVEQQLRNMAGKQNIKGGDINNLIDAYLAYSGQLH